LKKSNETALYSFPSFSKLTEKVSLIQEVNDNELANSNWEKGKINAFSQIIARELAETPANMMTPTIFAEKVQEIFNNVPDVEVFVRDTEWLKNKKMGGILAVSQGSTEQPKFVEIHLKRNAEQATTRIALVGKGVTFDSGGISIKPSSNMAHMKGDMSGGAAVVGALWGAASRLKSTEANYHIIGLIPLCENLPAGNALKPGDVIFTADGKSIEVDNTDAEGRLILADALLYAQGYQPTTIIDIATLTGFVRL